MRISPKDHGQLFGFNFLLQFSSFVIGVKAGTET